MTATQRKRAVQIAEDVLAQLKARKFVASAGTYVLLKGASKDAGWSNEPITDSLKKFLKKYAKKKSCHVCALGACFLANVERRNEVPLHDYGYRRSEIAENLEKIFSNEQMDLIEAAFERSDSHGTTSVDTDAAITFGLKYDDDNKRLRAIMRNIIKNNGEFIPPRVRSNA